jgi:hypothetical protein
MKYLGLLENKVGREVKWTGEGLTKSWGVLKLRVHYISFTFVFNIVYYKRDKKPECADKNNKRYPSMFFYKLQWVTFH